MVDERATRLCNRHGITVAVAHDPSGTSKWNPIEHRLSSEIGKNWAGHPLDSYDTILNYLRTTTIATGLGVRAHLVRRRYRKGAQVTDEQMRAPCLTQHEMLPKRNCTIRPA